MSFHLQCLVAVGLLLASGCASTEALDAERASHASELERLRSAHRDAISALEGKLRFFTDEAQAQDRAMTRQERLTKAVQASAKAERASLDEALAQLKRAEEKRAELQELLAARPAAGQAAELMRQLVQQNRVLKNELADARAGKQKQGPDLSGLIRPSHLDLEIPVAWIDREPLRRRDFVEFLYRDVGAAGFLDLFVHRVLLLREAKQRGLEISNVDVAFWVSKQLVAQAKEAGSPEKLTQTLRKRGFDRTSWEARLRYQAKAALVARRLVELNRDTSSGHDAWDRRLRAAYREAHSERVHARHIFVQLHGRASKKEVAAARRKIKEARQALERGEPFERVALRYSQDQKSRELGGSLGAFDRERFANLPNLNAVLFGVKVGTNSKPVRSRIGLHIVRVDSMEPADKSFAQVRAKLERRLRAERPSEDEVLTLIKKLRARARIKTNLVFDEPRGNALDKKK